MRRRDSDTNNELQRQEALSRRSAIRRQIAGLQFQRIRREQSTEAFI